MTATAFHFAGGAAWLFGWYHAPAGPTRRACGVVLCPPLGNEYLYGHRALRRLAEQLAESGFPTVRFDLHGTGDSAGDERDPHLVRTWVQDIDAAASELKRLSGASQVVFVGLRVGALLGLEAAAREDAAALVCWRPCLSGKSYVRQVAYHDRITRPPDDPGNHLDAAGFVFTPATMSELGALDVIPSRASLPTLVIGPTSEADARRLASSGYEIIRRDVPDRWSLLTPPHESVRPDEEIEAIVDWLEETQSTPQSDPKPPAIPNPSVTTTESPFRFGSDGKLFGIITAPARPSTLAIVLLNAGCIHHVGPHRSYVTMARRWTQLGYLVLRCDLSGLGDSPPVEGAPENEMFPATAVADVNAALNALQLRYGIERFVLAGLCSGATVSFQVAREDDRVAGVFLLNTAEFYFDDRAACTYEKEDFEFRRYLQDLKRRTFGLRDALRRLRRKGATVVRRRIQRVLSGNPVDVGADLQDLLRRNIDVLFVYSEGDIGLESLALNVGPLLRRPIGDRVRVEVVRGADHVFAPQTAAQQVLTLLTDHLVAQHPTHGSVT